MYSRSRRPEMPDLPALMLAGGAIHLIQYEQAPGFQQDRTPMCKAIITARRLRHSAVCVCSPSAQVDFRFAIPTKRSSGPRLILSIDRHRIMRGGATEPIARFRIGDVGVRTRIDEDRLALKPNQHT